MEPLHTAGVRPDAGGDGEHVTAAGLAQASWRKSSWSTYSGNCVEVAPLPGGQIAVRDTMDRESGHVLVLSGAAWNSFLSEIRNSRSHFRP